MPCTCLILSSLSVITNFPFPQSAETTALGAAFAAGLAVGMQNLQCLLLAEYSASDVVTEAQKYRVPSFLELRLTDVN